MEAHFWSNIFYLKHQPFKQLDFSADVLEKATDNSSDSSIIGKVGQGIVYKGTLSDNDHHLVAIKRSRRDNRTHVEQFLNEIMILSQISHKNVVKLLGCCLEIGASSSLWICPHWYPRPPHDSLRWRWYTAVVVDPIEDYGWDGAALSCLHSTAPLSIVHRNVRSSNILLDENFTSKVWF